MYEFQDLRAERARLKREDERRAARRLFTLALVLIAATFICYSLAVPDSVNVRDLKGACKFQAVATIQGGGE